MLRATNWIWLSAFITLCACGDDDTETYDYDATQGGACGGLTCDENATCNTVDGFRCLCNEGFDGDGETCEPEAQ